MNLLINLYKVKCHSAFIISMASKSPKRESIVVPTEPCLQDHM